MSEPMMVWGVFGLLVAAMLALDLGVLGGRDKIIGIREALIWSAIWVAVALVFNAGVYYFKGSEVALKFLAGYLIERALSLDNIFVFLVIFSYFGVAPNHQYKVIFWGIIGALVLRAVFIAAGIALVAKFNWIIYVFGALLVWTGIKMAMGKGEEIDLEANPVVRLCRRFIPLTPGYEGDRFFVRREGKRLATPLLVVLLVVSVMDVVFAVDSVPAVFAITLDPFIVFSSNVFAVLGLRALYFALAGLMQLFHYLHYGLALILVFVGIKMLLTYFEIHIPVVAALGVLALILAGSVIASAIFPQPAPPDPVHQPGDPAKADL
ncbi:MAG: TerC family protein [Candidatus Handelsmanbacteria bacterium]|nr:TerC family protein [Candidatus Handelsmanbacteria bacterium]